MPIYFFHLVDGDDLVLDEEGREAENDEAIPAIALHEARSILSIDALQGSILLDQRIDVLDGEGRLVHRLPFGDAVRFVPPPGR